MNGMYDVRMKKLMEYNLRQGKMEESPRETCPDADFSTTNPTLERSRREFGITAVKDERSKLLGLGTAHFAMYATNVSREERKLS